jgi:hypothetical protein
MLTLGQIVFHNRHEFRIEQVATSESVKQRSEPATAAAATTRKGGLFGPLR